MTVLSSATHFSGVTSREAISYNGLVARFSNRFDIRFDKDSSFRQMKLDILKKFLDGTIYDNLGPFWKEFQDNVYVPLAKRRPSVTYPLCKIIVDESSSMLFGQSHFPVIRSKDDECTTQFLQYVTRMCHLKQVMLQASKVGSVGSVCIVLKILNGKFYFEVLGTKNLTPVFDRMSPDDLVELTEKRKTDGSTLKSMGYDIPKDNLNKLYWFVRKWDDSREILYIPYLCDEDEDETFTPTEDKSKQDDHDFGFVPVVWIKNLPSAGQIDGACTFEPALDIVVEIDTHLSQNGRLLKYNSDPTLVIKNPNNLEGNQLIKGINRIELDEKGDAYYAEINGKSSEAVVEFVKLLREYGLEAIRGNRVSPEKMSNAQSGIGFEMMNMALVGLVEELRLTYGQFGLLKIYRMILDIVQSDKYDINYGEYSPDFTNDPQGNITLDWPAWYPPTAIEKLQESQALTGYVNNGIISKETAIGSIADEYNILDVIEEIKDIDTDKQKAYDMMQPVNSGSGAPKTALNGVQSDKAQK